MKRIRTVDIDMLESLLDEGKVAAAAMWAFIAGMMAMIAWDQW